MIEPPADISSLWETLRALAPDSPDPEPLLRRGNEALVDVTFALTLLDRSGPPPSGLYPMLMFRLWDTIGADNLVFDAATWSCDVVDSVHADLDPDVGGRQRWRLLVRLVAGLGFSSVNRTRGPEGEQVYRDWTRCAELAMSAPDLWFDQRDAVRVVGQFASPPGLDLARLGRKAEELVEAQLTDPLLVWQSLVVERLQPRAAQ